jgi:hypothetical protein
VSGPEIKRRYTHLTSRSILRLEDTRGTHTSKQEDQRVHRHYCAKETGDSLGPSTKSGTSSEGGLLEPAQNRHPPIEGHLSETCFPVAFSSSPTLHGDFHSRFNTGLLPFTLSLQLLGSGVLLLRAGPDRELGSLETF